MEDSNFPKNDNFNVYSELDTVSEKVSDQIPMKTISDASSDSGISNSSKRIQSVSFPDETNEDEPGQTLSEAMRQGEFRKASGRSQWGQYLLNVDIKRVLASGTFKLTLLQLARDGESETLDFLLNGLSSSQTRRMLNATADEEGATPLHLAAKNNHYDVCKKLIDAGASVSIRAGDSRATPLHFAARIRPRRNALGSIAEEVGGGRFFQAVRRTRRMQQRAMEREKSVIRLLHAGGANVNDADIEGQTPLHCATIKGNFQCVEQLLDCEGIEIDMKDSQGMTALHLAATHGYYNIVQALVRKGASIHAVDHDMMTPMHFACADGNVSVVRHIISSVRQKNPTGVREMMLTQDAGKNSALHIAVGKGHAAVVSELISLMPTPADVKALVNMPRSHGDTPIHIAASQGFMEICDKLILNGADVDARNDSLETPLLLAARHNNFEVVDFLHERGSDLETRDKDNLTPLLIACKQGHLETLSWLIQHGADCTASDKHDKTCLMLAVEDQRTAAVHELLKYDSVLKLMNETDNNANSVLHIASKKGYLPIVKVLLDHGARMDPKNEDEATSLHIAAMYGQHIILKELLDHDRTIINGVDENANTALHLAAIEGHTKCVETLIHHGANVGSRNTRQMSSLDCACSKGWEGTVQALLKAHSAVNPPKGSRTTPLHEASVNGHPKVVSLLLNCRADVAAKLSDGRNPLDCAIDQDEQECVEVILGHDCWRNALRNAYVDPVTGDINTPVRKLIVKMPEMAEYAFTRSIADNRKKWDSKDLELTLDFEFLDDMYSVTQWYHTGKELVYENLKHLEAEEDDVDFKGQKSFNSMQLANGGSLSVPEDPGSYEAYNDQGRLNSNAITYTDDTNLLRHNHPLMIMVSAKREALLQHPVVTALLQYKWNKYGGFVYYSTLVILMLFVILLNVYMLLIPPPYTVDFLKSLGNRRFYQEYTDEHLINYTAPEPCYSMLQKGTNYRGYATKTVSNQTCLEWSDTSTNSILFPNAGLDKNYCRNPGSLLDRPWCFTNYSKSDARQTVREECAISRCPVYASGSRIPKGKKCVFPFKFGGILHNECINHAIGMWCGITDDYDKDKKYGFCSEVDPYCTVAARHRSPCGKPGIRKLNCEARGCCFEVHDEGLPSEYSECFQKFATCSDWSDYCEVELGRKGCDHEWVIANCPKTCELCNVTENADDNIQRRFLILISTYPEEIFDPEWQKGCYYCLPGAKHKWGTHCRYKGDWETAMKICLIILCVFNLLRLGLQIWNYKLEAFKPLFLLELVLYILCLLLSIDFRGFDLEHSMEMLNEIELYHPIIEIFSKETGIRQNWQWQCGVAALFLSWMNLLLYIQKIPYLGIYVVMFNDIFKTFSKFSLVFLLFILSFAFTFHALLQNEHVFEFTFESILKATAMMVGELDFTGIFLAGSEEYEEKVNYTLLTYILFAIFIIVMMIIIMNLLVGLAVGDIMEVQQHATLERLKMQVELALEVEFSVPDIIRKRFVRKSATVKPNKFRGRNAITRAIFEDKNLSTKNISSVMASQKSESEMMQETLQQVATAVREIKTKVTDHDTMFKDLMAETREMKTLVDESVDVQQQKITQEEEAQIASQLPAASNTTMPSTNVTMPSPVPLRSLVPAFMRSNSFRRGSIGARMRSSFRSLSTHNLTAIGANKNGDETPLLSMGSEEFDEPPSYGEEAVANSDTSEKLILPDHTGNEEYEA